MIFVPFLNAGSARGSSWSDQGESVLTRFQIIIFKNISEILQKTILAGKALLQVYYKTDKWETPR